MPGIKKLVKKVKRTGTKARKPVRMVSKAAIGAGKVASALGARGAGRKISKAVTTRRGRLPTLFD